MRQAFERKHSRPRFVAIWWLMPGALALAGGCDIEPFRQSSELGDEPQAITIRATPPEAGPGDSVALESLVHWPGNGWEPHWLICLPEAGDALESCVKNHFPADGQIPLCSGDPDVRLCRALTGDASQLSVPAGLQIPPSGEYPVYVELVAASEAAGWAGCVEAVSAADPTADCLIALKTIPISNNERVNRNPEIVELIVDGVSVDATANPTVGTAGASFTDFEVLLGAVVDASSVDEMWTADASVVEAELFVDWYSTCGIIEVQSDNDLGRDRAVGRVQCSPPEGSDGPGTCSTAEVLWTPTTRGDCTVHVVIRDGSGGVSFRSQSFTVLGVEDTSDQNDEQRQGCGACSSQGGGGTGAGVPLLVLGFIVVLGLRRKATRGG